MGRGRPRPQSNCHPDRLHYCRGLCRSCYNKQPDIMETNKVWRRSKKRREWSRIYDKSPVRATIYRRCRHGFDKLDEARFVSIKNCDWCGLPFNGVLPRIDHDHKCCKTKKHCYKCTRGFVHKQCNLQAIAYYEWAESEFGVVDVKLAAYRLKFPVPRTI